jgi:CDP-glycerol glycerophosphotransferase (TagB/SpsB family)
MSRQVGEFVLVNDEKVERALHGTIMRNGQLSGGVGDSATDEQLLAEYDRLGGLILKGGVKVKLGSFFDFSKKKPRTEPEVVFLSEIDGNVVEVSEEEAQALKLAKEKVAQLKAKKVKKVSEESGEEEQMVVKKLKRKVSE